MTTLAQKFKAAAANLLPMQADLTSLDDSIDSHAEIDEIMFHKGEYIGGMASAILAMIEQADEQNSHAADNGPYGRIK